MELQHLVDTWVPEPPLLILTTMINITREVQDQGKIIDLKILTLIAVGEQELIVMKVLNPAKQKQGIGEGIRDMLQKNINHNIITKTSLEAVRHIGSHIATWHSRTKMTPTTCSSHFNLDLDRNKFLQFQSQLETSVKPELIHQQHKRKKMN